MGANFNASAFFICLLTLGVSGFFDDCPTASERVDKSVQLDCEREKDCQEISGIAISKQKYKGEQVMWAINDGDTPELLLFGMRTGKVIRRYENSFRDWEDVEDLTLASCGGNDNKDMCLYQADFGDNGKRRREYRIHVVKEPTIRDNMETSDTKVSGDVLTYTYPEGKYDAESLFVDPTGDIFIVSKSKRPKLYKYPFDKRTTKTFKLIQVNTPGINTDLWTAADMSLDGRWMAVAHYPYSEIYRRDDGAMVKDMFATKCDTVLRTFDKQYEAIAFSPDGNTICEVSEKPRGEWRDPILYCWTFPGTDGGTDGGKNPVKLCPARNGWPSTRPGKWASKDEISEPDDYGSQSVVTLTRECLHGGHWGEIFIDDFGSTDAALGSGPVSWMAGLLLTLLLVF